MIPGDAVETQRRRTDTIFSHAFYTRRKIPMCQEVASSMSAFSLATVLDLLDMKSSFFDECVMLLKLSRLDLNAEVRGEVWTECALTQGCSP